jgi:hypothetical protein
MLADQTRLVRRCSEADCDKVAAEISSLLEADAGQVIVRPGTANEFWRPKISQKLHVSMIPPSPLHRIA